MAQQQPPEPSPDDTWVDEGLIEQSECLLLGAYAMGSTPAACLFAANTARRSGAKLAISLASPRAVQGAGQLLVDIVAEHKPMVIGHQAEWEALLAMADPHTQRQLERTPRVITRSGDGATYYSGEGVVVDAPTQTIPRPTDMSGAGDAFAAGFMRSFYGGASPQLALQHGHQLGRAMVLQMGARLEAMPELVHGTD